MVKLFKKLSPKAAYFKWLKTFKNNNKEHLHQESMFITPQTIVTYYKHGHKQIPCSPNCAISNPRDFVAPGEWN